MEARVFELIPRRTWLDPTRGPCFGPLSPVGEVEDLGARILSFLSGFSFSSSEIQLPRTGNEGSRA